MDNLEQKNSRSFLVFDTPEEALTYFNSSAELAPAIGSKITPLLPISSELLSLIGFDSSLPSLFLQFSKSKDVPLPFSRATLFKLPKFASGALKLSNKVQAKLIHFIWRLTNQNFRLRIPAHATGGAAETWDGLLESIKQWEVPHKEWKLLRQFIEDRINLEHELLLQLSAHSGARSEQVAIYSETLRQHTLLPDSVLDELPSLLLTDQSKALTHTQSSMFRCSLKLDFYFSVIAQLELGWLQRLGKESLKMKEHFSDWFSYGVIHNFIKPIIFDENFIELKMPFQFYLNWLASDIGTSPQTKTISQAKLASFIPIERTEDTAGGYSKDEKQQDLLKDWKNSKYPSPSKFYEFIKNLRGGLTGDAMYLIDLGFAAIVLDRLFNTLFEQLKSTNSKECYQAMDYCIRRYSEYFQYYRNQVITE